MRWRPRAGQLCFGCSHQEHALTTAYDRVAYPSSVFTQTHPERLGLLRRLAGLPVADPRSARILEIGGGGGPQPPAFSAPWA